MRALAVLLAIAISAWMSLPAQAQAAGMSRIYIANACGSEEYKPSWLPLDCPGADVPTLTAAAIIYRKYGQDVAVATATFRECAQGCYSGALPSEQIRHYYKGRFRFSHVVRCDGKKGFARGSRLFYAVTSYTFADRPWVTLSTDLVTTPQNYKCPRVRALST